MARLNLEVMPLSSLAFIVRDYFTYLIKLKTQLIRQL